MCLLSSSLVSCSTSSVHITGVIPAFGIISGFIQRLLDVNAQTILETGNQYSNHKARERNIFFCAF